MSPTLNFPLFNQVSNVVVNEVDFNPEFISRMIPKVEWAALLQAAEQVGFCTKYCQTVFIKGSQEIILLCFLIILTSLTLMQKFFGILFVLMRLIRMITWPPLMNTVYVFKKQRNKRVMVMVKDLVLFFERKEHQFQ